MKFSDGKLNGFLDEAIFKKRLGTDASVSFQSRSRILIN